MPGVEKANAAGIPVISLAIRSHGPVIVAARDRVIPRTRFTKVLREKFSRFASQIGACLDAEATHLLCRDRADTVKFADRKVLDKCRAFVWRYDKLPVWLAIIGSELGKKLVVRNSS